MPAFPLLRPLVSPGTFAVFVLVGTSASPARAAPEPLSFNEHVQPILAENCYACHGADPGSRKAELRLDLPEAAFAERKDGGPAIVPGRPDASLLVQRIETTDERKRMPPPEAHKTLDPKHAALLRQWIAEGAEYQPHWAFLAPERPAPPPGRKAGAIDAFLHAKLSERGLKPSPEADRRTLIRRVSFDLTGLPPTPAEVEAFAADRAPDAYERLVDRLLASPRYGEHRARYWLDYVRYADTHGLHFDNQRSIWPYRDHVIRAFNENKPFDAFVRGQLAGDLLPERDVDTLVATGLMRMNLTTNEGGTVPEEVLVNQTRDRVEAFGVTFLGLTTGCAACHDHKFDPFSQKDFYRLAAFLSNTAELPWDLNIADPDPVLRLPTAETKPAADALLARISELRRDLEARRVDAPARMAAWLEAGNRPQPVGPEALELHLRFDEGAGDTIVNHAPDAAVKEFKAEVNPLIWGENSWLWPSVRMDIATRLPLGASGDFDAGEAFSAAGWIMLRGKPGLAGSGTGNGVALSRMGGADKLNGRGWALRLEDGRFVVNLVHDGGRLPELAPNADGSIPPPPAGLQPAGRRGLEVATRATWGRHEWLHVAFTYDGSRKATGVKIFVNGEPAATDRRLDNLRPEDSIRTPAVAHLGRRDDDQPLRETRYQDVRLYRRELSKAEAARLPFENLAAEIVARQPDPAAWTTDESFVALERFFLERIDQETRALTAALADHDAALAALTARGTATLVAREKPSPAYESVLKRGDYFSRGERVEPGVPEFLPPLPAGAAHDRRGLADWLFTPEQPLFARVAVNRMWQEVFGRGLVESTGDFGVMGARPSHPALLDWLAVEFRESGWDVKRLYKLLVTSAAYRRSARVTPELLAADPDNLLLGRGPRFRMEGEMLRDSALATSGLLVEKLGGPSVKPYQPPGIWEEVAMPESNTRTYVPDTGEGLYRRSIYSFLKRASPPPSMETFDATSREVVCVRRARSNTPLQAFVTMNDTQWVEAARRLAERSVVAVAAPAARLDWLARTTLGRPLEKAERTILERSRREFVGHFQDAPEDARALLGVGDSAPEPGLDPAEVAAWTLLASQFYNLDEFLTK